MAVLDPNKVKIAIGKIRSCYDADLLNQALRAGIELRYAGAHVYADSIEDQLYTNNPDDALAGYRGRLSAADRQRCLMALLATRKEAFPLAIHMYIGLMEWVSPDEIKNIMFLTGIYMGVPTFVAGIDVLGRVIEILAAQADGPGKLDPLTIVNLLKEKFS